MYKRHFLDPLKTKRLYLRKYDLADAASFANLLKDKEVAATTLMLPYPCDYKSAKKIISYYLAEQEKGKAIRWALTLSQNEQEIIGGMRLVPNRNFNSAELGFWIGKSFWRNGYTLEAAKKVIEFGFNELELNRLEAHAMVENVASIRLLESLGFKQEGYHPELVIKWGKYKDVITFGLLKNNYPDQ